MYQHHDDGKTLKKIKRTSIINKVSIIKKIITCYICTIFSKEFQCIWMFMFNSLRYIYHHYFTIIIPIIVFNVIVYLKYYAKKYIYNKLNSLRSACTSLQMLYSFHIIIKQSLYSWHALDVVKRASC